MAAGAACLLLAAILQDGDIDQLLKDLASSRRNERDEAAALKIAGCFSGLHGARDDYRRATKKAVLEQIVRDHDLTGAELAVFGDGYVEIENAKSLGGLAVGVASNETERRGVNARKRERLIQAGADLIVPDFREHERLIAYLFADAP